MGGGAIGTRAHVRALSAIIDSHYSALFDYYIGVIKANFLYDKILKRDR